MQFSSVDPDASARFEHHVPIVPKRRDAIRDLYTDEFAGRSMKAHAATIQFERHCVGRCRWPRAGHHHAATTCHDQEQQWHCTSAE